MARRRAATTRSTRSSCSPVAGAATTTLRLQTHVFVVAYRNPFLAAKSVLSLDRLSGGRVILGVASGYLRPEFGALGVDFDERNELTDEAIDAMVDVMDERRRRRPTAATSARAATRCCRVRSQQPHPPIWVGGNSNAAIRRAVERGQGWLPFPNPQAASQRAQDARRWRSVVRSRASGCSTRA